MTQPVEAVRLIANASTILTAGDGLGRLIDVIKFGKARMILGGTTSTQGGGSDPAYESLLARNVEGINFGRQRVLSRVGAIGTLNANDAAALRGAMSAGLLDAWLVHLAEGVRDGPRVAWAVRARDLPSNPTGGQMKRFPWTYFLPLLAALLLLGSAPAAVASSGPRWSPEQLTDFSAAIVTGRVAAVATATDARSGIYTYVTIDVSEVLKGSIPGAQIVLKQAGGIVGDLGLSVSGQATFSAGEEVLVFAEVRPRDSTLYTTALWQGKWALEFDAATGARVAVQQDDSIRAGSTEMARLDFDAMRESVARRAGQDQRAFEFDAVPAETPGHSDSPFVLYSIPTKWRTLPVRIDVQAGGQPGLAGGGLNQLANVVEQWNTPSIFKWTPGSLSGGVRCGNTWPAGQATNFLMIEANDPCGEISDTGGTLAVAFAWITTDVEETFNGIEFTRMIQVTVITNNSASAQQFVTNSNCYNQVMLHEVGHALGLGHSAVSTAVMAATVSFSQCSAAPRPLQPDDIAGVQFIYGGAGGGSPGQPVVTSAGAAGGVVTVQWTSGAGGAPTGHRLEFLSGATIVASVDVGPGTTYQTAVPPGVQGAFSVRVMAANASGVSPFSAPFGFTIGGGAPGQPTITGASASGGILTVSWASGTGASPTTHRLAFFQGSTPVASVDASGATSIGIPIPAGTQGAFAVVVTAFNGAIASPASAPFSFTIGPACTVPTAPAVSGGVAAGTATASWPAVAGAARYVVSAGTAPGGTQYLVPTDVTGTSVSASGLSAGFQAWVRVVAVNACGQAGPPTDFLVQ